MLHLSTFPKKLDTMFNAAVRQRTVSADLRLSEFPWLQDNENMTGSHVGTQAPFTMALVWTVLNRKVVNSVALDKWGRRCTSQFLLWQRCLRNRPPKLSVS